jgi:hypothetical protein
VFVISPMCATCPDPLTLLGLVTTIISGKEYKLSSLLSPRLFYDINCSDGKCLPESQQFADTVRPTVVGFLSLDKRNSRIIAHTVLSTGLPLVREHDPFEE